MDKMSNAVYNTKFSINYFLTFVLFLFRATHAQYYFKNAEDREICTLGEFLEISPYRVVSLTQMSWQSAHACCKVKGMVLHTIEKSMESAQYPLQIVLPEKLGKEAEYLQFWIGLSYHKKHFQWTFGSLFSRRFYKIYREVYRWVDGQPKTSPTTRCVAISPYENSLEMRAVWCNLKLNFICQKVPRIGGEPLSGSDMMVVGSAKFIDIPGFENLKFSTVHTRWPVANKICQSRNWALIDRVHERYSDNLAITIRNGEFMFNQNNKAIHTSGNDFCEANKWQWACGERLLGNIPWIENTTHDPEQLDPNGRCLQYVLQWKFNGTTNWTLVAHNVGCNEFGYTICDTTPSCATNDQYPCMYKDPHFIAVENDESVEKEQCRDSQFHVFKTVNGSNSISYWISSSKLTWLGANNCCKFRGWQTASPKSVDELTSLQNILLSFTANVCENEEMCDGFWTSTTTLGHLPHSPLRFTDGRLLSRSLYSLIRADEFTYPSCGRITFMNHEKTLAKYVHADCLEKNVIVCEESTVQTQKHNIVERKVLNDLNSQTVYFKKSVFETFLESPTEEDLGRRSRNRERDACPIANMLKQYSVHCQNSVIELDPPLGPVKPPNLPFTTVKAKMSIHIQNQKILLQQLVENSLYARDETEDLPSYAFQFLSSSVDIFSQLCPIVPRWFLVNAFELFRSLYTSLNPKQRPEMISHINFDWAMRLLTLCNDKMKPMKLKQDRCGDLIISENNCTGDFVCTEKRFESNFRKWDLLLDVIWKVFEAIHAVCFPAFKQNPSLHHKYAMVITDLWESEEIRLRWTHQIEEKKFWKRLLGPYFEVHVLNIERCNTATISNSYFHVRLPRTSVPRSVRMTGFAYERIPND